MCKIVLDRESTIIKLKKKTITGVRFIE